MLKKNQRVDSCEQTFYYCQFRATQIERYSSDKIRQFYPLFTIPLLTLGVGFCSSDHSIVLI